jgi:hypothetical protein
LLQVDCWHGQLNSVLWTALVNLLSTWPVTSIRRSQIARKPPKAIPFSVGAADRRLTAREI